MEKRRITYDNELEIMIEDYLANPLEAELERVIEGLEEEELAERRAKVQSVLEGREKFEIPSAQILHNIMEVWRAFRPSVYKKLKRMEIMPLEAERLLQEQGRIKSKLPYNRETTDMFTLIGKDQDPLKMKCAAAARLSEGRSPEFRSRRRINPWNSKHAQSCETLYAYVLFV